MLAADEVESANHGRRLRLMAVMQGHARALHKLIDDWQVVRMLAVVPWPVTLEDVEAFAARAARPGDEESFAVIFEEQPIGVGGVKRPGTGEPPRTMPRLGYWLGRRYWGQGFGTELAAALTARAFATFPEAAVVGAGVFADNPGSRRVLEKLGFRAEGSKATFCRARECQVETINMLLTRDRWSAGIPWA
jgi:[ribosomal protein S5]-alanine N-acetyltransferase